MKIIITTPDETIKYTVTECLNGMYSLIPVGASMSPVGLISRLARQLMPCPFTLTIKGKNVDLVVYYKPAMSKQAAGNFVLFISCDDITLYTVSGVSLSNPFFVNMVNEVGVKYWEMEKYTFFNSNGDFLAGNYAQFLPVNRYISPSQWLDKIGEYDLVRGILPQVIYKVLKREGDVIYGFVKANIQDSKKSETI